MVCYLKKRKSRLRDIYRLVIDVEKFKSQRAKEVSPATVNRALAVLKSMFNRAIVWGKTEIPMNEVVQKTIIGMLRQSGLSIYLLR